MRRGFLIDMDGVIYRGGHLIPGAAAFIQQLQATEAPFTFLTNNSQRTRRDVATRLRRLGIDVTEHHIFTCAMATARFLARQKANGTAYVIGEGGLLQAMHENGYAVVDHDPDYVVVGEGRTISFEMVEAALGMILGDDLTDGAARRVSGEVRGVDLQRMAQRIGVRIAAQHHPTVAIAIVTPVAEAEEIRGMRRRQNEDKQRVVAEAIVTHLELSNWAFEA